MSAKVGHDIESICGKCGDVWHVVVAMKGDLIAKVQCKQCGGYHRHRPPGQAVKASAPRARAAGERKKQGSGRRKQPDGPVVDASGPPRRYRIDETFQLGDAVEHATFGTGVVERVLEDRKVEVWFPEGRRVLAHQRS